MTDATQVAAYGGPAAGGPPLSGPPAEPLVEGYFMAETDRKYVRVYYSIRDDERFAGIYEDDHHLAAWLRLLLDADAVYPAPASIPAACRGASFKALRTAGIIEAGPSHHYRVHGLAAERERRAQSGRNAAAARWHSGPDTVGNAPGMLDEHRRDETSKDKPRRVSARASDDPYDEAVRWLASRKAWVDSPKLQTELARLVDRKGIIAVLGAMEGVAGAEDAAQFIFGARNALYPLAGPTIRKPEPDPEPAARAERTARELQAEDDRRTRLLSQPMKPLRDLMPDVKLGKAP